MAASTEYKQEQDYQVIQEKIVRKRKQKWKKRLVAVCATVSLGVLFGLVARYAFLVSDELLISLFGLETEKKQEVNLLQTTTKIPTPSLLENTTPTPTPKEIIKPSKEPTLIPTPEPEITQSVLEKTEESTLAAHIQFYEEITELATNVKKAFVTVTSIESGVDWFDDTYETRKNTSGILLGSNGIELLILVNAADIQNADTLEVTLSDHVICEGMLYSSDQETGLAIIGVRQEALTDKQKAELSFARLSAQEAYAGMPVLALGSLNGHEDAIEYGMITSVDGVVCVVDRELSYYTTNMPEYAQAGGFLVNFKGEIIGMLTHTMRQEQDEAVLSAVSMAELYSTIQKLLNHVPRAYCGIKLSDIPVTILEREGLSHGIYVTGVELSSPALLGGLQNGDIITEINGESINSVTAFEDRLLCGKPEEVWNVTVVRGTQNAAKTLEITVILQQKTE